MQRTVLSILIIAISVCYCQTLGGSAGPCSAVAIPVPPTNKPFTIFGNNIGAQRFVNPNETSQAPCSCPTHQSGYVWYSIRPTDTGNITVSTCNNATDFDTVVSVYNGTCGTMNCTVSNDDGHPCSGNNSTSTSSLTFTPVVNQTYYIAVYGYGTSQGNFQLTISHLNATNTTPPCESAAHVHGPYHPQVTVFGSNVNGTAGFTDVRYNISASQRHVWYQVSPVPGVPFEISTCHNATNFDTVIHVFNGTNCPALNWTITNDDNCTDHLRTASKLSFVPTNSSYYVSVSGYAALNGSFAISFSQEINATTACTHAPLIQPGNSYHGNTVGAVVNATDSCSSIAHSPAVWYRLQLSDVNTNITLSTCSLTTDFDTVIAVYQGTCSAPECFAVNDDASSCGENDNGRTSTISFVPKTNTYFVAVAGYGASTGSYELIVSQSQI